MDIQPPLALISTKRRTDPWDTRFIENLYLNAKPHHHLSNKQAVLNTLVHTARVLCYGNSLQDELEFLKITFKQNGYSDQQIQCALNPTPRTPKSTRSQFQLHSYHFYKLPTDDSTECCPDTTTNVLDFHIRISSNFITILWMILD